MFVNTRINNTCIQCLDGEAVLTNADWFLDLSQGSNTLTALPSIAANGIADVENGVLILLHPVSFLLDGRQNNINVQCSAQVGFRGVQHTTRIFSTGILSYWMATYSNYIIQSRILPGSSA